MMSFRTGATRRNGGAFLRVLPALLTLALSAAALAEPVGHNGVKVEKWAGDLAGAQGLARAGNGEVWVAEHDAGRVSRYSADGKKLGVLAEGLQAPSWALTHADGLLVAERKGNSVAHITAKGELTRLPGEIIDPLGLARDPSKPGAVLVVSHRTSQVRRFTWDTDAKKFSLEATPVVTPAEGTKYGWRDLTIASDGTIYVTDEVSNAILRRKVNGELVPWVEKLSSPSGLGFSPNGTLYVTEEGTGRVSRISADGKAEVLAEGLGAARALLFLDARTLLVSDRRGGAVWKVTLPSADA
jgi:sugar lactone lactonase YvrE